jgi:hypothetical protein
MANTQAMCNSFKLQLLSAGHNFSSTNVARTLNTVDVFKAALYLTTATMNSGTTVYTTLGEVTGTAYTAGGATVTNATAPLLYASTATWNPSANLVWTTATLATAFDTVLIYNSSQANAAVSVHTFGAQTVTAGTFTLTMPTPGAGTSLINLA